jgi:hypothetical protein
VSRVGLSTGLGHCIVALGTSASVCLAAQTHSVPAPTAALIIRAGGHEQTCLMPFAVCLAAPWRALRASSQPPGWPLASPIDAAFDGNIFSNASDTGVCAALFAEGPEAASLSLVAALLARAPAGLSREEVTRKARCGLQSRPGCPSSRT